MNKTELVGCKEHNEYNNNGTDTQKKNKKGMVFIHTLFI